MTESVDGNQDFATNDSLAFQTSPTTSPHRKDLWSQYLYRTFLTLWHSIENLLFYAGVHPSYLVFRVSMAFQLFAGRLRPFLGVGQSTEGKKGESGASDSESDSEAIAMVPQNRTLPVKRRRAQVSEHSFHGK